MVTLDLGSYFTKTLVPQIPPRPTFKMANNGTALPSDRATTGFAEEKGKGKAAERVHDDATMEEDDDEEDDDDEESDDEDFEGEVSIMAFAVLG